MGENEFANQQTNWYNIAIAKEIRLWKQQCNRRNSGNKTNKVSGEYGKGSLL